MAALRVAAVIEEYAHESLTFRDAVACEVISKWISVMKEDMDTRSNYMGFTCKSKAKIWVTKGLLDEAKEIILGMEIFRTQSGNTLRGIVMNKRRVRVHVYMTLTGKLKEDTWLKGFSVESGFELRTMTNTRSNMTPAEIEEMINQRMDAALEAHRVNRDLELGNRNDNGGGDGNGNGNGNGNRNGNGNGTGNGNNRGNNGDGNENRNVNGRGDRPGARECTYQDLMKCKPLSFKGTEGVVGLIRWSENMEIWNSHKRTIGTYAAYALSWRELLKLMTEYSKYFPSDLRNKLLTKVVKWPKEEDRVEKFIGGLPDNIQGNVIVVEPTRLQDAVRIANNLMDQKLIGLMIVRKADERGDVKQL
ncbi:hypothetical protein Tco_0704153 [Tanacetum coccineum]|uniref:Reverse transcriptase domain-containing protein n=1 Tax=Tanacetum coccineum TaxID=301880 RepID=A0ABQ4Y1S3_9ASTR